MPDIVYHLIFANEIVKILYNTKDIQYNSPVMDFISGNLIPDFTTDNSHFKVPSNSMPKIYVPDLDKAQSVIFNNCFDPIRLGLYAHLYLDYYFVEDILFNYLVWGFSFKNNPNSRTNWQCGDFLANINEKSIVYTKYTKSLHMLLERSGIVPIILNSFSLDLPSTGIPLFDNRNSNNWKIMLYEYLNENTLDTKDVFNYNIIYKKIVRLANNFVFKEYNILSN